MAIIHCGFVPHQNKSINQWLISSGIILRMIPQRNHSRDRSHQLNIKRNMKYLLNLSVILIFNIFHSNLSACTIFCASSTEKKLMAGNEDWQGPFSKIWVHEISKDNYGVLYIGHSDYQVQFGINEYGLALDFCSDS